MMYWGDLLFRAVKLFLVLFVSPTLTGYLMCRFLPERQEFRAYKLVVGFICMVAFWELIVVPPFFIFTQLSFRVICVSYIGLLVGICVVGGITCFRKKVGTQKKQPIMSSDFEVIVWLVLFFLIVISQLFNTIYYAPVGHIVDDVFYYDYINDIVYMDKIYLKDHMGKILTGNAASNVWRSGFKLVASQWYTFLAFLAVTLNIHPLILCRTVMPVYIIILTYLVSYSFATYCFKNDSKKKIVFLASSAFILEILSYSYYLFFLTIYISTWGKIVAGIVGVPILLFTYVNCVDENKYGCDIASKERMILIFMISTGVSTFSFAAMLAGGAGLLLLMVVLVIKTHGKNPIRYAFIGAVPYFTQIMLYLIAHTYEYR